MSIRLARSAWLGPALLLSLLFLMAVPAFSQAQDLVVDICTTPNKYWNKEVLIKGHVIKVTPDPPGTNRGRFTLRDHTDKDIEIITDDLPALGKIYIVKGVVEQRKAGDTVPVVREHSRILSSELADQPVKTPPSEGGTTAAPAPATRTVVRPPTKAELAELVRIELEKKEKEAAKKVAEVTTPVTPPPVQPPAPPAEPWYTQPAALFGGAIALIALVAVIAFAARRKPESAAAYPPPAAGPAYAPPPPPPAAPDLGAPPPPPAAVTMPAMPAAAAGGGAATMVASRGTEVFTVTGGSLIITEGPDRGRSFTIGRATTAIGRPGHRKNEVELTDSTVSRDQARIVYDATARAFTLFNESSTNPTRVNGREASNVVLQDGDTIEFGGTVMKFKKG